VFGTKSAIRIRPIHRDGGPRISVDDLAAAVKNGTSYVGRGQLDDKTAALLKPNGQLDERRPRNLIVSSQNKAPSICAMSRRRESVQDDAST